MFFLAESHNTGDPTPYLQAEGARMRELQQAVNRGTEGSSWAATCCTGGFATLPLSGPTRPGRSSRWAGRYPVQAGGPRAWAHGRGGAGPQEPH